MQIKFSTLQIEGFRSIVDPQEFNLDQPGLNMIKGTNGKGKTTLFEALVWGLYGANLKGTVSAKVQSWKEVRGDNYQGTKVVTTFTVDKVAYVIERNKSYHVVGDELIVKKAGERIPELDKKDTQKYIDDLLTMDFATFMNSFMFGQRMTRLVEAESKDKRKLFEELFNMEWVQKMRDKAVLDKTDVERVYLLKEQEVNNKKLSMSFHEDAVEEANARLTDRSAEESNTAAIIGVDIAESKSDLKTLGQGKDDLEKQIDLIEWPLRKAQDFSDEIVRREGILSKEESDLSQLNSLLIGLKSKREAVQEQLDDYDDSNYNDYLSNLAKAESGMKDIVTTFFPDDSGGLLSDVEQAEIQEEYELALTAYNTIKDKVAMLQGKADSEPETVCPTCARPFDDAAAIEEQQEKVKADLLTAARELGDSKVKLDAARADANLLKEYQKLEQNLAILGNNAPDDPEVFKKKLQDSIDEQTKVIDDTSAMAEESQEVIDGYNKKLDDLDAKQQAFTKQQEDEKNAIDKRDELQTDLDRIVSRIQQTNDTIEKLEKDLLVTKLPELRKAVLDKQDKLKAAQEEMEKITAEMSKAEGELEIINFWVKDVFAANGLKAYIFKAMLDQLNQYTAKYGAKLGCSMRFSLDLTKVSAPFSTICTLGDKVNKDYKEFSGGEKQRLDIVLMFAMHDLLSSNTDINVLIMDEVFEGLDEQGESDVFELIREKAEGRSVFVISHSQVLDTLHSHTIEINNENGRTILP